MSDSHGGETGGASQGSGRSSARRLLLLTALMLFFAAFCFLPSLFARGAPGAAGVQNTSTNFTLIFIPVWLTMTVAVVVISFWFAKRILTAERYRDAETPAPPEPGHH